MIAFIKIVDTGKIARVAYIHGIGYGLAAGFWLILTCLEITVEDVVGIISGYETLDWQAHAMTEKGCRNVSEITAWHTNHHIVRLAQFFHSSIGIEIIECLRKESSDIDGIG